MSLEDDKIAALEKIKTKLEDMLSGARNAANLAQTEANYHVGAMQSRYDTFKEEAQYLVQAQKLRMINLSSSITACEMQISAIRSGGKKPTVVEVGAYVKIRSDDGKIERNFFVVPDCAGERVIIDGQECLCIMPDAPVISPFVGLTIGDYSETFTDKAPDSEQYIAEIK